MLEYYLSKRALLGPDSECGDTGLVIKDNDDYFLALLDVLGHGREARKVAILAETYLQDHYRNSLPVLMEGLHQHLRGSRGCVAVLGRLTPANGELSLVGIGNITVRVFAATSQHVVLGEGVIGFTISTPRKKTIQLQRGDVLLLYSDGIKEFFSLNQHPDLLKRDIKEIAVTILREFGKENDDASCLALRLT